MTRLSILLSISSLALLAQAGPTLTVDQGYLSRHRTPGTTAHVWAQQNTATRVFAGWAGDTQHLLDASAPYTTFLVPTTNVALRATYRTVPAWTHTTANFNSIPVSYYIPPSPIGLVFLFHGTGGTGLGHFTGSEFLSLARDLVAGGFAVAAFDCLNRETGQWNTTIAGTENPDVVRLNGVITAMKAQGLVAQDIPLFAFGHSNGGQFSHFSSPVMRWTAVYISCVQGSASASASYTGPVAWWMGKNDDHPQVGPAGVTASVARYEQHVNRGLTGRHWITPAMPLYPERIARSNLYVSLADSQEVYNIFKAKGWLDANDFLTRNPNEDYWRSSMPARFTAAQLTSTTGQLEATNAGHEFSNITPHIILDHFLQALGRRPVTRPVSGASFTGTSIAANSIATIFLGGLADGLEVGANGAQANLRNVRGALRSAAGVELPVQWFFVSPGQASFLVPAGAALGNATLKIDAGDRRWSFPTTIAPTAPGIFAANGNGQGAPAAVILRVAPDGSRSTEFPFAAGSAGFVAAPIRFGEDRLFLDLYATGVRGSSDVQVILGTETITPLYAGAQPQFPGLDQVTIELPKAYAGRGTVTVSLVAGGVRSNAVALNFAGQ